MNPIKSAAAVLLLALNILNVCPAECANILIPGYEVIRFKADTITQGVRFRNPSENNCTFRISLSLEDGTNIWTASDLLEPGEVFLSIDLAQTLKKGTYRNALMKYECFTLEDSYRLNGADIRVTIEAE